MAPVAPMTLCTIMAPNSLDPATGGLPMLQLGGITRALGASSRGNLQWGSERTVEEAWTVDNGLQESDLGLAGRVPEAENRSA